VYILGKVRRKNTCDKAALVTVASREKEPLGEKYQILS